MDAQVFISFASQDDKVAKTLCSALEGRGFKCWISSRDILPGENFQVAIVRAIRKAKVMLLVFTANSNSSEEMNKELALASQGKLAVVPLRIDDVTPNDAFRYEFATRQWVDFFADWELAMTQLSAQIAHIVGTPASLASPTVFIPQPPSITVGPTSNAPPMPAPSSLAAPPAAKGAPVALFVAFGVVIVLLLGGVLALQLLGGKSSPAPAVATTPAPVVASPPQQATIDAVPLPASTPTYTPPPAAVTPQPLSSEPPPATETPVAAKAVSPPIATPQIRPPRAERPRNMAASAPRPVRRASVNQTAPDEGDEAPRRRSNVPDEGDEAPH